MVYDLLVTYILARLLKYMYYNNKAFKECKLTNTIFFFILIFCQPKEKIKAQPLKSCCLNKLLLEMCVLDETKVFISHQD